MNSIFCVVYLPVHIVFELVEYRIPAVQTASYARSVAVLSAKVDWAVTKYLAVLLLWCLLHDTLIYVSVFKICNDPYAACYRRRRCFLTFTSFGLIPTDTSLPRSHTGWWCALRHFCTSTASTTSFFSNPSEHTRPVLRDVPVLFAMRNPCLPLPRFRILNICLPPVQSFLLPYANLLPSPSSSQFAKRSHVKHPSIRPPSRSILLTVKTTRSPLLLFTYPNRSAFGNHLNCASLPRDSVERIAQPFAADPWTHFVQSVYKSSSVVESGFWCPRALSSTC